MTIRGTVQELDPGAIVELFEIDTVIIGGLDVWHFHAGTNNVTSPIVFQGVTYENWPVDASGFEVSSKGTQARPSLKLANTTGLATAAAMELDDLVGAKVTRRRTFSRYLDGMPQADPDAELPLDVFYIERKVAENKVMVEWELCSILDLEGVKLPFRTITTNVCMWDYRSAECSYTGGAYFDVNDVVTSDPLTDVCGKRVASCKCRFGQSESLPFGGFPASRTYKS